MKALYTSLIVHHGNRSRPYTKGNTLQGTLLRGAAVATLGLAGFAAHASCADPRSAHQLEAHQAVPQQVLQDLLSDDAFDNADVRERIVGTWQVSYTVEGSPFAQAFIQWHRDGTEWENISLPVLSGNICMGSWKRVDESRVSRNHIGWLYTNGTLTGYFTETETDEVAQDGKTYSGTNQQKIYDLAGTLLAEVTGTSKATRIAR